MRCNSGSKFIADLICPRSHDLCSLTSIKNTFLGKYVAKATLCSQRSKNLADSIYRLAAMLRHNVGGTFVESSPQTEE
jgi:hypothetical protein